MILLPSLLKYLLPKYPSSVPLALHLAAYLTVVISWMSCLWVSPRTAEQFVFNMESASYLCQWCWRLMVLQIMSFTLKKYSSKKNRGIWNERAFHKEQMNREQVSIFAVKLWFNFYLLFIFWMIILRMQISDVCSWLVLLWHKCEYRASCI